MSTTSVRTTAPTPIKRERARDADGALYVKRFDVGAYSATVVDFEKDPQHPGQPRWLHAVYEVTNRATGAVIGFMYWHRTRMRWHRADGHFDASGRRFEYFGEAVYAAAGEEPASVGQAS
jgi:hypothetical protein